MTEDVEEMKPWRRRVAPRLARGATVAALAVALVGCSCPWWRRHPVPPPAPSVALSKGRSAQGQPGCTASACSWLNVSLSRFPANATIALRCWDSYPDNGYWYTTSATTNGAGAFSGDIGCYFGYAGQQVRVDSSSPSVRSNTLTW